VIVPELRSRGGIAPDSLDLPVEVKGSFVRGYCAALKNLGWYPLVMQSGSAQLKEALERPPPTSTWVDYALVEEALRIIETERGLKAVRKLGHDAVAAGVAPLMQIVVQSLLRLFGVSPASFFAHLQRAAAQTLRGVEHSYAAVSAYSGIVTITLPNRDVVPAVVWYSSAGGLEIVFETCGVIGHVQDPVTVSDNAAQFRVTWRSP
jgi:hypothetical protein